MVTNTYICKTQTGNIYNRVFNIAILRSLFYIIIFYISHVFASPAYAESQENTSPIISASNGVDEEHHEIANRVLENALAYLRSQQDDKTGGWAVNTEGPNFPGITAMVLNGLLLDPQVDELDPCIKKGTDYLLSFVQINGGIYDRILPNYNTSLALSALSQMTRSDAIAAIKPAQIYIADLQWVDQNDPDGKPVDKQHPYYGGVGYGQHGRPDNSNLTFMVQALYDSGYDCDSIEFKRAIEFLQRTQMLDEVNDMQFADNSNQGGFIYATSTNKDNIGIGESKAGVIEEILDNGTTVSRLRCYGSMTYAGFKSYVYAQLDRDDIRVQAAYRWICNNYTLKENPGVGMQGYYYYLMVFSRALDAWGDTDINTTSKHEIKTEVHNWAHDLIDTLDALQNEDGSFVNNEDRWMEGDPVLVTAYVVIALRYATN